MKNGGETGVDCGGFPDGDAGVPPVRGRRPVKRPALWALGGMAALGIAGCPVYGDLGQWEQVGVGTTGGLRMGRHSDEAALTSSTGGAGTGGGTGGAVHCAPAPASGTPLWGELFASTDTADAHR